MEPAAYAEMRALEDRHWWFAGRRRLLGPLLAEALRSKPAQRVMEVGCGTGGNLAHASARHTGLRLIGLDFDPGALRFCAQRGLPAALLRGEGTRLPLRDGTLDCVLALDIIEHFEDDEALLRELARVLEPGGQLVASVPLHPWLWSPHDEFLHHKRRYRGGELELKLARAGFRVARAHGFNFLLLPPIALVRGLRSLAGQRGKARGKSQGGTDFFALPGPLNSAMGLVFALEALVLRALPVRGGVSLLLRAVRT